MNKNNNYINTLEIKNLHKKYGKSKTWAIEDISFSCKPGEIIGVLGANGAGKSTTLKCITGMIPFDKGEITICGYDIKKSSLNAKHNFSFVTDSHVVFEKMTGIQYLSFMADIFDVTEKERNEQYLKLEKIFNLGDKVQNLISSYSHGMKQKICMMGSLIHSPNLWILDEPFLGLDPLVQQSLINFMHEYVAAEKSILFSSHNLDAVKKLCHRVILISHGKLIKEIIIDENIKNSTTILEQEYLQAVRNLEDNVNENS